MGLVGAVTPPRPRRADESIARAVVPADASELFRTRSNRAGVEALGPKPTRRPPVVSQSREMVLVVTELVVPVARTAPTTWSASVGLAVPTPTKPEALMSIEL